MSERLFMQRVIDDKVLKNGRTWVERELGLPAGAKLFDDRAIDAAKKAGWAGKIRQQVALAMLPSAEGNDEAFREYIDRWVATHSREEIDAFCEKINLHYTQFTEHYCRGYINPCLETWKKIEKELPDCPQPTIRSVFKTAGRAGGNTGVRSEVAKENMRKAASKVKETRKRREAIRNGQ